jgi:hypothetical protein
MMDTLLILCCGLELAFVVADAGVALLVAAVARSSQMSRDEQKR